MTAAEKLAPLEACGVAEDIRALAARHAVTVDDLFGVRRLAHLVRARNEAMALVRTRLDWSYPAIGALFGRDHVSVMYAIKPDMRAAKKLREAGR